MAELRPPEGYLAADSGPFYTGDSNDAAKESNSSYRLIFGESGQVTGVENWTTVWSKPDNICNRVGDLGSGACEFNSICSLNENRRPTCRCPQGLSLLDPDDKYGSCKPDVELDCREDGRGPMEDLYGITVTLNTDCPGSINDHEKLHPYDEQNCETACLRDCMCTVAIWNDDNCWKKKLQFTNGRDDDRFTVKALIKIAKGDRTPSSLNLSNADEDEEKNKGTLITVSTLLGTSMFVNFALVGAFCLGFSPFTRKNCPKFSKLDWRRRICRFSPTNGLQKPQMVSTKSLEEEPLALFTKEN
ncbi:hypothetical protein F3Y22_tig00110076pilonHSYRG00005 [Hibiscus syriacus]|uniref:Apple domain-containing protein n=1 Tax=Hibiscus syriacus TaxID=106335 RepID=A0A6A3BM88_HIBSY|nr:hypothetical protein F3Y22_tig00110076pilonHSYRG00005 [Hibiscus syriacus]